jgi:hypothetical protein
MTFTPTAALAPTELQLFFDCGNTAPAAVISGVNTFQLSGSTTPVPDIIALAATLSGDGIVNIPGPLGTGAFAVASVNVGTRAHITVSAEVAISGLPPVTLSLSQTNPSSGPCLAPLSTIVTADVDSGATPTFAVFVRGQGLVLFNPATNRVNVLFKDHGGATRGATGVAVRTQ